MSPQLAAGTSVGLVRKRNEDSAYAGHWLCAVADGMGGHVAGDIASAEAIDAIRSFDIDTPVGRLTEALGQAIRAASGRLAAKISANRGLSGMGTTLTAMLWSDRSFAVANLGDSRGYVLRAGKLTPITEDHVLGKLVAHPAPAQISAYLVRFLDGLSERSPDLTLRIAQPGDRYLLCSDGLSGVLDPHAIRDMLAAETDAEQAVTELIRLTHEAGAPDNVTVIVADVPEGTWQPPERSPLVLGAAATSAAAS